MENPKSQNDDFTQEYYDELFRRIKSIGYEINLVNNNRIYANIYLDDALVCQIDHNGQIECDWPGKIIKRLAEEVKAYVQAYRDAYTIVGMQKGKLIFGYRRLIEYNDYVLAAKNEEGKGYIFAVGYKPQPNLSLFLFANTYNRYSRAIEDFSFNAGLLDKDRILSENELKIINSGLIKLSKIDPKITIKELTSIGHVINKIDCWLIPDANQEAELEAIEL